MIYVCLGELVVLAFLVWSGQRERAAHDKAVLDLLASQEVERAELLTRIQRPELVTVPRGTPVVQPPKPRDAANFAKIGVVAAEAPDEH